MTAVKVPTKKIMGISIKIELDEDADLSHIGTWSNTPDSKFPIEHTTGDRHSYKYFHSTNAESKQDAQKDYEQMVAYNRHEWCCVGIRAIAEVGTSCHGDVFLVNKISSGGLWGTEVSFDSKASDRSYLVEIKDEQLDELKIVLLALNFTELEIDLAYQNIKIKGAYANLMEE